ncbi:MAG: hypothetical protein JSS81_02170 [Acidobacteria bacterium]|nr:hypothetical protein [Acidobacteriota bacterium]
MISKLNGFVFLILLSILFSTGLTVSAQVRAYRVSDGQVQTVINRLETRTDDFRRELDRSSDNRRNNAQWRDDLNSYVGDFEKATDNLKNNFTSRRSSAGDVQDVLNRAGVIDGYLRRNRFSNAIQNRWNLIRTDLNTLAGYYRVSWNWNSGSNYPNNPNYPNYPSYPRNFDARLTGTYRLNTSRSDNVSQAIDRALRSGSFNANQRDRIQRNLERRLSSPDLLIIEKRGQQVTLASSMSPQVTFSADGVSRSETNPNGRTVETRVTATNNDLTINYEGDRMNDFYVSFAPAADGQLRVTRRLYLENQNQTVTVTSVYDKTENSARWNDVSYPNANYPTNGGSYGDFIVANNTRITATLDTPLSTRSYRDGDRFSMTVTSPSQYRGAVIEGRVNGQRSGVVSGRANLSLDFDTIRLNGRTYRFAGIVDSVRQPDGKTVSVNNEGTVRDGSQTTKTVTRAGIGAALGAIIGAIAGGGSGAAIGAGIGAGAGAGTVILQGRDNLELSSGTEFTLTATSPLNR